MGNLQPSFTPDHAERRVAPRFSHELHTWIQGRKLLASNFSLTGMQIVLAPEDRRSIDSSDFVAITIDFPNSPLLAKGRVVYVAEDDDHCLIGLDFTEFLGNGGNTWRNFVDVHEKHAAV
ncbi:MAG: PilZ domain-containing protein [Gammaproteobacteria bacterium]|nr:PilZ domain-containing protein [Gammaproteobacteria bacterium]